MKIVMFGPPGSGKGTHGKMLAERLSIPHISTGEMFRHEVKKGTSLGKRLDMLMSSGKLVDDSTTIEVLESRLKEHDAAHGYVLDGFPRNIMQAKALDKLSAPTHVLFIDVAEAVIIQRFASRLICRKCEAIFGLDNMPEGKKCPKDGGELYRRPDDSPESVKKRLDEYRSQTMPLADFYRDILLSVHVKSETPMAEVYERILNALELIGA